MFYNFRTHFYILHLVRFSLKEIQQNKVTLLHRKRSQIRKLNGLQGEDITKKKENRFLTGVHIFIQGDGGRDYT